MNQVTGTSLGLIHIFDLAHALSGKWWVSIFAGDSHPWKHQANHLMQCILPSTWWSHRQTLHHTPYVPTVWIDRCNAFKQLNGSFLPFRVLDTNDVYSVKNARLFLEHKCFSDSLVNISKVVPSTDQHKLWKLIYSKEIFPPAQLVLFRIHSGHIPSATYNLKHVAEDMDLSCPYCRDIDEDMSHRYVYCPHVAQILWLTACYLIYGQFHYLTFHNIMYNMPVFNRCKQWKIIWSTVFWAIYKFSYEFSSSAHLINSLVHQPRVVIKKFQYELLQIIAAKRLTSFRRKTNSRFEEA